MDHPCFGHAVVARLFEHEGLRVAILPQPNWRDDLRDFKKLGRPRMFFAISSGMDSMVNHYTAAKRLRSDDAITALREYYEKKEPLPDSVKEMYQQKLREYLVVGGMPDVVNAFVRTSNFLDVFKAQQKIFKAYEDDIQQYTTNTKRPKIRACYYSLPRQLSKEYPKFQYKLVEKNGSARKFAGLACRCRVN